MKALSYQRYLFAGILTGALWAGQVQAQSRAGYLTAADAYFAKADYSSAVAYYEKFLRSGYKAVSSGSDPYAIAANSEAAVISNRQLVTWRLAESYRLLHYYAKAAPLYQQTTTFNKEQYPLAYYYYAVVLRAQGKYEEAEAAFTAFLNTRTQKDEYGEAAAREVKNLQFIKTQLSSKAVMAYTIHKLAEGKDGASYAPVWMGDSLLFTATWPEARKKDKWHNNYLYQAAYVNDALGEVVKTRLPASDIHEGAATLSEDGKSLYLTRWTNTNGKKAAAIFLSKKAGAEWSVPVALDATINTPGANAQQPFLLPGGRTLLYVSDRQGGYGGYDIWYAQLDEKGSIVKTANLGSSINTAANEQAPYYHKPSATLVFATDGRTGMGGYDLFYSKGSVEQWSEPVNFGYPVNSVKDDMYFVSTSNSANLLEHVVLSSDRTADCCLELLSLHKKNQRKLVTGKVVSCTDQTPLAGVAIRVLNADTVIYKGETGDDGVYAFTLDAFSPLSAVTVLRGYVTASFPLSQPADVMADSLIALPVCLQKEIIVVVPAVDSQMVLRNISFAFNEAALQPASYTTLDSLVTLLVNNPQLDIEVSGHTDDHGAEALNQALSEARAASIVTYLVNKGIDKNRLTAKGYGASKPIAPNKQADGSDNPEGREQNRRTEIRMIQRK